MDNSSFLTVPRNLPPELQRFLQELLIRVDEAYGNRGSNRFVSMNDLENETIPYLSKIFVRVDGSNEIVNPLKYTDKVKFTDKNQLVDKNYVDSNFVDIKGNIAIIYPLRYVAHPDFNMPTQLVDKQYVDDNFKANNIKLVTADYTTTNENVVLVDDSAGNVTITLGDGYDKQFITIKKISNTYNTTTINDKTLVYVNDQVTYLYYNNQWIEC